MLFLEDVHSLIPLPSPPSSVDLRQKVGGELAFVTIINGAFSADVVVKTASATPGTYYLELESYDSTAIAPQETLKIDKITIYVTKYIRTV